MFLNIDAVYNGQNNTWLGIRLFIMSIVVLIFTGCVSKKEIQLEFLSIVNKSEIEEGYLSKKYLKHHKSGTCITKVKNKWYKTLEVSNKFLKIKFSSKEKVFKNVIEDSEESAYVNLRADGKSLMLVGLCPLVERNNKEYVYSYFYPIKTLYPLKEINLEDKKFDLKRTNTLLFSLSTVGYSRWKTNEIVITKEMIDKLEF